MDIELYLILSAAYEYTREPPPHEGINARKLHQRYINGGIEDYFHQHGYTYEDGTHTWTAEAKKAEIARRRTQGAKDGWEIRRGKQSKK